MPHLLSTIRQPEGAPSVESQRWGRTSIHKLDDDSLLNIFYLCRLALLDEVQLVHENTVFNGTAWNYERWWYKPVHVCQRWRHLILGSASYLHLCLVCTPGMPIAAMLAHSPHLPLMIYYDHYTIAKDKEINLALGYHNRIRRICLQMPAQNFQKVLMTIGNEFPILEDLMLEPLFNTDMALVLPRTFQAPQLRRLILRNFAPIGSPLFTTATGIVLLSLINIHPSAYFPPNDLIQHLSHMPQLQILNIVFRSPSPSRDVERQLVLTPITTHVTLPNLRRFRFKGTSAYLEALLPHMVLPLLEEFNVIFFNQLTFSVPCLLQFMHTAENLRGSDATFNFSHDVVGFGVHPSGVTMKRTFQVIVLSARLHWQVSSIAQIVNALSLVSSGVEHLTLSFSGHIQSPRVHNEADRTPWRKLFGSFSNVKTLRVAHGFNRELSRFLTLDDGESPLELLPELNELTVAVKGDVGDAFTSFIDARRNTDRPVTLVRSRISLVP
ncbi:hypothetical protein BC826DRAFT_94588 [Russula brevipes]|nr:hypothetical protein BC826DRAFT_94588 [Russula brevipes]